MEVVSLSPFPAECLLWEADAGQPSLTVVVKVTLRLVHDGEAVVDETQLPITGDETWDENPAASLFHPGDRAPLKPRTDLLLVGRAYAPGGKPVERLVATMKVGDFSKSVTVSATRLWTRSAAGFVPGPPMPFEQMSLRYERGALSQDNPVGVDPASAPLEGGAVGPVLEAVGPATSPCFGPIAATWRPRRRLLGEAGRFWALAFEAGTEGPKEPAPRALDFKFFNAAPPDQQTNMLRQRAEIELVNLNPTHPVLRSRLPALRPQVFRTGPHGGRAVEVALRCDTVWIDSDRGLVCLVWRGLTDVPSMSKDAVGTIVVVADPQGRRVRFEQVERAMREGVPIEATEPGALDALSMRHDAIRSRGEGSGDASTTAGGAAREKDETRAFGPGGAEERAVMPFAGGATSGQHAAFDGSLTGAHGASGAPTFDGSLTGAHGASGAPTFDGALTGAHAPSSAPASSHRAGGTTPPPESGPPYTEDDTHDRPPDEPPARPLPFFVERPAMLQIPPAPALPSENRPVREAPLPSRVTPVPALVTEAASPASAPFTPSGPFPAKPANIGPIPVKVAPAAAARPAPEPPKVDGKSAPPPADLVPAGFDPKDIAITTYGSVSAELMIRRGERARVLESNHLAEPTWARIHAHWTAEMGRETARGESKLLAQFDAAYVETMGRLRTPIGVPEYAAILVAIERGAVDKQLAALKLSLSDLMRVQRVWTRRLAEDPELGKVLGRAVEEARAAIT